MGAGRVHAPLLSGKANRRQQTGPLPNSDTYGEAGSWSYLIADLCRRERGHFLHNASNSTAAAAEPWVFPSDAHLQASTRSSATPFPTA